MQLFPKQSRYCTHRRGGDISVPVMQGNIFDSRVYQLFGLINIKHGLVQPQVTSTTINHLALYASRTNTLCAIMYTICAKEDSSSLRRRSQRT